MSDIGHNSNRVVADELRALVERIERVDDEISLGRETMREIYKEAKSRGYDTATIRKVIALRKKDPEKLAEEQALLEMYGSALGVFG